MFYFFSNKFGKIMSDIESTSVKRRKLNTGSIPASEKLNPIPVHIAKELLEKEEFKPLNGDANACMISVREFKDYPKIQIPKQIISQYIPGKNLNKGQMKVMLHQLAFRSTGNLIPNYESNIDIVHLCQNGRKGCFNPKHLSLSNHKDNMQSQGCKVFVVCQNCKLLTHSCSHQPKCIDPSKNLSYNSQKKIKKIVFEDDSEIYL
jgi:hypothetical protein